MNVALADQLNQLFLSCGMGLLLGLLYDGFRVPRLVMRSGGKTIFFQDVLFCLLAAVITFLFALAIMDGRLRFYLFLGEAIGFGSYYFTIGRLVMRFARTITNAILFLWHWFWTIIFAPFRWIFGLLKRPVVFLAGLFKKTLKNTGVNLKKSLKDVQGVLYNHIKVSADKKPASKTPIAPVDAARTNSPPEASPVRRSQDGIHSNTHRVAQRRSKRHHEGRQKK